MHILLETGRLRLRHGFEAMGVERISARTLLGNLASQRVMRKCGLREVGRFEYPEDLLAGRTADERAAVKFAITRPEWLQRSG
jgi:RimJ/RimL family protein N-acetyltransferase